MEPRISAPNSPSTPDTAIYRCTTPHSFVWGPSGEVATQLLYGENFSVRKRRGDRLVGNCAHDGYPGAVCASAFEPGAVQATHRVVAHTALIFAAPSIKSPLIIRLPLGARIAATGEGQAFLHLTNGYVHRRHLERIDQTARDLHAVDPVGWAERLIGAPYLWGGRASDGLDCSGLVQLTLGLSGIAAPRDSGPQGETLGTPIGLDTLARGDLVFMPGHVVLMVDAARAIHANAHWMAVVVEPLADVLARLPADVRVAARRL